MHGIKTITTLTFASVLSLSIGQPAYAQPCDGVLVQDNCIARDAKRLDISSAGLTNVSFLSAFTQLEALDMGFNPVVDLSPLRQLTNLRELSLAEMRTDDAVLDLAPLADLQTLVWLDISDNVVSDLWPLGGLQNLDTLIAFSTNIDDLAAGPGMTSLRVLQIQETGVTSVAPLAKLSTLQTLYLSGTDVTDLAPLAELTALVVVGMPNGQDLMGQAQIQDALKQ